MRGLLRHADLDSPAWWLVFLLMAAARLLVYCVLAVVGLAWLLAAAVITAGSWAARRDAGAAWQRWRPRWPRRES